MFLHEIRILFDNQRRDKREATTMKRTKSGRGRRASKVKQTKEVEESNGQSIG